MTSHYQFRNFEDLWELKKAVWTANHFETKSLEAKFYIVANSAVHLLFHTNLDGKNKFKLVEYREMVPYLAISVVYIDKTRFESSHIAVYF